MKNYKDFKLKESELLLRKEEGKCKTLIANILTDIQDLKNKYGDDTLIAVSLSCDIRDNETNTEVYKADDDIFKSFVSTLELMLEEKISSGNGELFATNFMDMLDAECNNGMVRMSNYKITVKDGNMCWIHPEVLSKQPSPYGFVKKLTSLAEIYNEHINYKNLMH